MMTFEERLDLARRVDEAGDELSQELVDEIVEFQGEMIDAYADVADGLMQGGAAIVGVNRGQTWRGDVKIPVETFNKYVGLIETANKRLHELLQLRHPGSVR